MSIVSVVSAVCCLVPLSCNHMREHTSQHMQINTVPGRRVNAAPAERPPYANRAAGQMSKHAFDDVAAAGSSQQTEHRIEPTVQVTTSVEFLESVRGHTKSSQARASFIANSDRMFCCETNSHADQESKQIK